MAALQILGMKHSGKSTLGALAARRLGWDFADLDYLLEKEYPGTHRLSAREIYRELGQETFQAYEARAALKVVPLLEKGSFVLAWGGGTATNPAAVQALRDYGVLVLLEERSELLFERIVRGGLPAFLSKQNPWEDFQRLYQERMALMETLTTNRVTLGGSTIEVALTKLLQTLEGELHARQQFRTPL